MPLPRNLTSQFAFEQRYVNPYVGGNAYELVRTALIDLSDDPNYVPFNYDDIPDYLYFSQDETRLYSTLNDHYKNDGTLSKYLNEFNRGSQDEPYFTDKESYKSFMERFYDFLCKKIWETLQQKYPDSPDFEMPYYPINYEPVKLRTEEDKQESDDTMDSVSGLISKNRLTLPEGVNLDAIRKKIEFLQERVGIEKTIKAPTLTDKARIYLQNRMHFKDSLKELDEILAPGLTKGENAPFDEAYYSSLIDYRIDITNVLAERLKVIRDINLTSPEKGNVEKMMGEHFALPKSTIEFRNNALAKLIRCREELLASDHFFQKSSQEFKDMKAALDIAIGSIRSIKKASFDKIDAKSIRNSIEAQLNNVSEKTNLYLIYKEDGPTGLFGASRVAAAKSIRDAIRSLTPAPKESKIISDCKNNIKGIFGKAKAIDPENTGFNLSEASQKIAGYIAPCSGTNLERFKAFYMFNEDFERDYAFAKNNRIDLVLDYLKHPNEADTLKNRVDVTKNNYKPVQDAKSDDFVDTKNALGYRYVGASYAIKGLIDKMMGKKTPDVDTVLLGELTKSLNEDIKAIKDVKLDPSFKTKIYENTKYAKAAIATTDFLKKAMALEEKGTLISSLRGDPHAKDAYTKQEFNALMKTSAADAELNTMLVYSFLKKMASGKTGMQGVINTVFTWQAADPNWTWDKMADDLRKKNPEINDSLNKLLERENHEESKEVNGKVNISGGSGHIMRNYSATMSNLKKFFDAKVNEAAKETIKTVNEISKQAKPSGPAMK